MKERYFTVVLTPDFEGNGYTVEVPLLPGCGATLDDALENVREAIELYIASLMDAGEPVPQEPMPAAVLERALREARETIRECAEDLGDDRIPAELPEPELATVAVVEAPTVVA